LAIDAAAHGDIGPLRQEVAKLDLRYRRYVNLPRLKRGQHFKKRPPFDARQYWLEEARKELPRVRAIWKKHYSKTYRPAGQIGAVDIVAARWGVAAGALRLSRKRTRRHR
jgi:hypothetical protein